MDTHLIADTIRGLAMDGVQRANSGHPGMPMGTADFATILFTKYLKHNPRDPRWPDRDRYVQSAGHGSMLIYSLLHLFDYGLTMDELKAFRQWGSRTPGHPEHGLTPGVETTTGPLGQGCGNAVGMAIAEAMLAGKFNRDGYCLVDHYTYVIAGDGDLMEGVSHEAFSLAGHLGLNKLIVFYDSNRITIEGGTDLAYSDDVRARFEGYNWNVLEVDGHDHAAIDKVLRKARMEQNKPTLIIGHTHIAKGSPHAQDTSESHGAPLGPEEVAETKKALGLPADVDFHVPDEVRAMLAARVEELAEAQKSWETLREAYGKAHPELSAEFDRSLRHELPAGMEEVMPAFDPAKPMATRQASGAVIQSIAKAVPQLVGGSADLAPSNNTLIKGAASVAAGSFEGRNLHFGIREHAMASVMNGMALHGGWIVYGGTFLTFSDYMKPSIRLAAMMELPVVFIFTHDSIFLGEDGPTHQPIEHLAALRSIPNLSVIRPADATETAAAWLAALRNTTGPTALILSRQALPVIDRTRYASASKLDEGAYVLWQSAQGEPDVVLLATGSEVSIAMQAAIEMARDDVNVRVVSMPSWDLFEKRSQAERDAVIPESCPLRIAIEAGVSMGWDRYVGPSGRMITIDRFGASAPHKVLAEKFGFTASNIVSVARDLLAMCSKS